MCHALVASQRPAAVDVCPLDYMDMPLSVHKATQSAFAPMDAVHPVLVSPMPPLLALPSSNLNADTFYPPRTRKLGLGVTGFDADLLMLRSKFARNAETFFPPTLFAQLSSGEMAERCAIEPASGKSAQSAGYNVRPGLITSALWPVDNHAMWAWPNIPAPLDPSGLRPRFILENLNHDYHETLMGPPA